MSVILTSIISLPWVKIIRFIIDMAGWWKSASDEKKEKLIKQMEVIDEIFKTGGSVDDVTIGWDDIDRLR